jgi:glycosyltransferase involved in cell wall biosynthesis
MKNIRAVLLFDEPGWAWHHRALAIQKWLRHEAVQVHVQQRGTAVDAERVDFVVMFGPYHVQALAGLRPDQVILGAATPFEVSSLDWALEHGMCVAGLVNSLAMHRQLRARDRAFLCQNGVDTAVFYPSAAVLGEPVACWVGNGRSQNNKGVELIADACRKTGAAFLPWDASAGAGHGRVLPLAEIRDRIYHRSTFYVCMSEFEGTPNPALEALACGLPVISTRVGNMPEVIRDGYNGFIIDRSVQSLTHAIQRILTADISRMRANARESVLMGWTWEQQARKYERMLFAAAELQAAQRRRLEGGPGTGRPMELEFLRDVDDMFWRMRQESLRGLTGTTEGAPAGGSAHPDGDT